MKRFALLALCAALALGCSEPRETLDPDAAPAGDAGNVNDVNIGDAGNVNDVNNIDASTGDAGNVNDVNIVDAGRDGASVDSGVAVDAGAARVIINEVRASGDDWVELYNAGTASANLEGFTVADTDTAVDGGAPRGAESLTFPAGTTLAPGEYLVVVADLADAGAGPQTGCLMGALARCFHANFGISAGNGETVYLVAPNRQIVDRAVYPANAVAAGQSLGRLPDAAGDFAPNRPTPGAPNAAP
ncbi:MAG: lamin tail domain-containing protein [Myxococcales bacterium]|nr:lamin tail domain-containing protein [Myxococcales bacterium]